MGDRAKGKKKQKANQVFENQIKPKLDKLQLIYNARKLIDPVLFRPFQQKIDEVISLKASILDHNVKKQATTKMKQLNTIATPAPTAYYVIVGCGTAAVVNHTTLRQSETGRERIGDLPLMHLGFEDPWRHFKEHGMGQPPHLLRLPGYHKPVPAEGNIKRHSLSSKAFAKSTKDELNLLTEKFNVYCESGWVAAIESDSKRINNEYRDKLVQLGIDQAELNTVLNLPFKQGFPPYRLLVVIDNQTLCFVYAQKIDFCSGAGPLRSGSRELTGEAISANFANYERKPWIPPEYWDDTMKNRIVINGVDGLTEQTQWKDGQNICINGSGGIFLNQIERAEEESGVTADWLARGKLEDNATFALRRNDTVLENPESLTACEPGDAEFLRSTYAHENTFDKRPCSEMWRFGEFCKLESVVSKTVKNTHSAGITLIPSDKSIIRYKSHTIADISDPKSDVATKAYDKVILCFGQDQRSLGEPSNAAKGFTFNPIIADSRFVGLTAENGDIRIMGAAATMFPGANTMDKYTKLSDYHQTLPVSAVLPGFILSVNNIAHANDYFAATQGLNYDINTASVNEIATVLESKSIDGITAIEVALDIVKLRSSSLNNFTYLHQLRESFDAYESNICEALASKNIHDLGLSEIKQQLIQAKIPQQDAEQMRVFIKTLRIRVDNGFKTMAELKALLEPLYNKELAIPELIEQSFTSDYRSPDAW